MRHVKLAWLVVVAALTLPIFAQSEEDLSKLNPLTARGFFVSNSLKAGDLADLQIEMEVQEGFFAYHDRFRLKVLQPQGLQVGELNIDPLVEFEDTTGKVKKKKLGVSGSATLKTQIEIPVTIADTQNIQMALSYIACTKKFCLTPRTRDLSIVVQIEKSVEAKAKTQDIGSSEFIQKQIDENFAYALALIFLFGLLTSLTPCVYPLIPITLAVLGTKENRSQWKSFLISLCYVLGIGLTYATLGVMAAQTGQLFGSLISHPLVIVLMSLVFFAMGLSLLGLFELQAPAFIRNRYANSQTGKGYLGAFASGLLAGIIASPCVGPVLVGVLAYIAKTQNSSLGFALLFTFAMGFGVLFIVLGTFSQLTNKMPRSGVWMNTIKTILALILFSMSFYYAWPLVKRWMPKSEVEHSQSKVTWQAFSTDLVEKAKMEGQPVIIDFYADWCAACVEMDQFTFSKQPVIKLSKNFVMLKVDATSPFDELSDWQQTYEVYGLPTMIFIDASGIVRKDLTLTGFEEAELFLKRMDSVLKNNP